MTTLAGQTIVVLGGSSGIGYAVALGALKSQAGKVIIASTSADKVANAVQRLKNEVAKAGLKGEVVGDTVDAGDLPGIAAFFKKIGPIDHLVNTAGRGPPPTKTVKEADLASMKPSFDLKYWGALQAVQSADIKAGGSIIFTTGVLTAKPWPGYGLGVSIGGALETVTRGLAVDLAPIRVNTVSPGLIHTELVDAMPQQLRDTLINKANSDLLVKHVGSPEECAEAYLFLMKCGFITGETIQVNGGHLLV